VRDSLTYGCGSSHNIGLRRIYIPYRQALSDAGSSWFDSTVSNWRYT